MNPALPGTASTARDSQRPSGSAAGSGVAERLAASEADLHTCVELVTLGCNPVVAAEILL